MNKFYPHAKKLLLLAAILTAFVLFSPSAQAQTSSTDGSKLVTVKQETLNLANKALDELELQDRLIAAQDEQLRLTNERLETEKKTSAIALDLADSRKREAEALRAAVVAAKDAIAAKDSIIANKDKEIEILKKKKPSFLTIVKTVAVGIGIGMILR
jgi:hypothetical protein